MEGASCSILHACRFSSSISRSRNSHLYANAIPRNRRTNFSLVPPFRSTFSRKFHLNGFTAFSSLSSSHDYDHNTSQQLAVLLEVEGVLVDAYRLGNRQAFNEAFQKLGLDCANWTEPVYKDLIRKGAGNEERMLNLFFNRIGWPTSLPTNEKGSFVKKVLRQKGDALDELLVSKRFPLRPGVEEFIDNANEEGIHVVILTAYSRSGDIIARHIVEKLGHERVSKLQVISNKEVEQSCYGQLVLGKRFSSGLDDQLAEEAKIAVSAEKQRIAEGVASVLKLSVETGSSKSLGKIVAALHAGAESVRLPVNNCVLIAGSQAGVDGAQQVGMPCVVLRSSLTSRAEFPSANATLDGFGGADLTISSLRQKILSL